MTGSRFFARPPFAGLQRQHPSADGDPAFFFDPAVASSAAIGDLRLIGDLRVDNPAELADALGSDVRSFLGDAHLS